MRNLSTYKIANYLCLIIKYSQLSRVDEILSKKNVNQDIKNYIFGLPVEYQSFAIGKIVKDPSSSLNDIKAFIDMAREKDRIKSEKIQNVSKS